MQPAFAQHRATGIEHRINRRQIVSAAFGDKKKNQRHQEHPPQHAKTASAFREEIEIDPGERERQRQERDLQLIGQKSAGPADPDIAGMDVLEECEGDKIMSPLPEKIWQEKQ